MEVLLRHIRRGTDGAREYQDTDVSVRRISIGSAADCVVQLLGPNVAPHHAELEQNGPGFTIKCSRGLSLRVNDGSFDATSVSLGDRIELDGHVLALVNAPAGFDLAIEIELNPNVAADSFEKAFRTRLADTWLSKRKAAWISLLVVLLLGIFVPLATVYLHRAGKPSLRGLPDDTFWSSGALLPAHQLATSNIKGCANCHQQIFAHVPDKACKNCHLAVADHVASARLAMTGLPPAPPCATCHAEHKESRNGLIVRDTHLCTDCHARPDSRFGSLLVSPVTGFAVGSHPEFKASLPLPKADIGITGSGGWPVQRISVKEAKEQSNLKFSHAQHLDGGRVQRSSDGGALGCGDCHVLNADGEHFLPITMQRTCSGCHELTFDPAAPTRQLPHGRPKDAVLLLQDYYARKYLQPVSAAAAPAPIMTRRRLPDRMIDAPPVEPCVGSAAYCARHMAEVEIEGQFSQRGCVSCHVVRNTATANVPERYDVTPIHLATDYFPDVQFSHKLHANQNDRKGDEACVSCHAARGSRTSSELLLPGLGKCLECHSQERQINRVPLQCMSCHAYHPMVLIAHKAEDGE